MSEHELSTMLRDHLSDEPPIGVRSHDAIRTGRRQGRVRLAGGGVAVVAILGLAAATVPGLVADDGKTTAHESPGFAAPTTDDGTYTDQLQAVAEDELAPLVDGGLGTADLFITDVDVEEVAATSPDVQGVAVNYDLGDTVVNLGVNGFAPEEFATLTSGNRCTAPGSWAVSCDEEILTDGSHVVTEVMAFERYAGVMRTLSPTDAASHPSKVFWGRLVKVDTPAGMSLAVTEYVKAPIVADAEWQIPVDALRGVATHVTLLDPAGLAHSPICGSAHTTC